MIEETEAGGVETEEIGAIGDLEDHREVSAAGHHRVLEDRPEASVDRRAVSEADLVGLRAALADPQADSAAALAVLQAAIPVTAAVDSAP